MGIDFRKLQTEELQRKTVIEFENAEKIPVVVVLDNIRSANNVGSIFRTSDAFLVECLYLCGITSTPPNKEIHKTALGAQLSVPWKYAESTLEQIKELRTLGYTIVSVEQVTGSVLLQDFEIHNGEKIALILGNEVFGVQDEVVAASDLCIEIPQLGTKHSFNVSVTYGMVIWELTKQFR